MTAAAQSPFRQTTVVRKVAMDTVITFEVVASLPEEAVRERVEAAFGWFRLVEAACSRFDPESELSRLCDRPGQRVAVSALLFQSLRFALRVAEVTGGRFDPTVGDALMRRGFDRNYVSGRASVVRGDSASFRDVVCDAASRTVLLRRPLTLDLGAVAKGLAVDLAARELAGFQGALINAGGDVLALGYGPDGRPWRVGIRHPEMLDSLVRVVAVSGMAVCTSGDYERVSTRPTGGHHIVDGLGGQAAKVRSATVIATTAMAADALRRPRSCWAPTRVSSSSKRLEWRAS